MKSEKYSITQGIWAWTAKRCDKNQQEERSHGDSIVKVTV